MHRIRLTTALLAACMGGALLIPLQASWQEIGQFPLISQTVGVLAFIFIIGGVFVAIRERRRGQLPPLPMPVRVAITGNILFLAFCALEFSDGLVRQNGRVFYWTSVLFLPSLALLYGLVRARRWAWWTARIAAAAFALWFLAFLGLIPFVHLQSGDTPIPWIGRVYALIVTLVFATASCVAFRSLGTQEARHYFGLPKKLS